MGKREELDLRILALNGLRRGRTTGSCATAAMKAALYLLLQNEKREQVDVSLPDGSHFIVVPIQAVMHLSDDCVRGEVIKDGGDDPDNTHGATIFAEVRKNDIGEIRFFAGKGVGTATQPGLKVKQGEPAINPTPRQMMREAVAEVLAETAISTSMGFDLTIGCENGEQIAKKTFNPRLGVLGGISILGTSGIVEPMSLAAWIASIEAYVRVALGGNAEYVAYLPGKIGRPFSRDVLKLPEKRVVQIANFLGESLEFTEQALREEGRRLDTLWLVGHPGKLAKVLDGVWDTHSSKSEMAMGAVARVAADCGFDPALVKEMESANTVEAIMEQIRNEPNAPGLWAEIERRVSQQVHEKVPSVNRVEVRLFGLHGNALGEAA